MFAMFRLMKVFNVAYHYIDIKAFYNSALHIPDVRYNHSNGYLYHYNNLMSLINKHFFILERVGELYLARNNSKSNRSTKRTTYVYT